jgi:hypothetical protein
MLKALKDTPEKEYNVISLDSEADDQANTYVWCVYGLVNGKEIKRVFDNKKAVVSFLFKRRWNNTILTGVNVGFDLNTLKYKGGYNWEEITNMGRLITASPKEPDFTKIFQGKRSNHLKIIDLSNWILNRSLQAMAKMFNLDCHIDKHILGKDGDKNELTKACMSHAKTGVLVFKKLEAMIHKMGGHIQLTGSATALDLFRRKYLKPEFFIYDFDGDYQDTLKDWMKEGQGEDEARKAKLEYVKEIGKSAYVGGRCENFNLGLYNDVDYLDINSSYPFQMRNRKFPDINSYRKRSGDLTALKGYIEEFEGEALIKVRSPKKLRIPFLHYKREDGKLIFPLGEFTGWYTFPEIKKALEIGYKIIEIIEIAVFDRIDSPFIDYIEAMMFYKKQPDTKEAAKLLMNGLSGKMGQMTPEPDAWQLIEEAGNYEIDNKTYFEFNGQIWKYEREDIELETKFVRTAYPLLVAYITAWGRIQEYETIEAIGQDKVYYMDTDSIIADHEATQKAIKAGKIKIDDKELGAYKLEHEGATVDIRGLKYYRIHDNPIKYNEEFKGIWTYHIKGVPAYLMPSYWIHRRGAFNRPVKPKTAIRTGLKVNLFIRQYHADKVKNDNKRQFTKRDSQPFTVIE